MPIFAAVAGMAALAAPAFAADDPPPRVIVSGSAMVSTPPDRAQIDFTIHGEGATSDEAVTAMVARRQAIDSGLARFGGRADAGASRVAVSEVRAPDCNRQSYGAPRLSTGACAIIGYTADLTIVLRTAAINDVGTIVGLIGRLGGSNPHVDRFFLADDHDAQRRATAAALLNARREAEALAAG
ncbi:SIMPL domain-containing protein, partial [Sphingomonas bacterium]|uniref:SIMPL domain-containing protein n=1 Tax=Sphingomonas bacterium TaxID=1895847 RepID=UPI00157746BE